MIFPFKISEYHWEAELMFNIKRINARVIQLAPDLCSYTSSDLEVSCNEVRLQAQASPDIFLVCGRSHVTVRSSGAAEQLWRHTAAPPAALQHCTAAAGLRTVRISLDFHFHQLQYSVNLEILSISIDTVHYPLNLSCKIEFLHPFCLAPMVRTNYSAVKLYQNSAWQQSSCQESDFFNHGSRLRYFCTLSIVDTICNM